VLNQIIAHTDGVPLFVEELTKTVLESGLLDDAGERYALRGPLPALAIPSTLHASLLARLDRLAAVKDVAQTAATIGREFSYALISAVAGLPEQDLQAALAKLVGAELVFQRGVPPDAQYLFKHALVQDAAYASLVRTRRQQLHAQIARAMEERFPDVVEAEPEVLAHHFTAAGLAEPGAFYWQRAGQLASDRSAYQEATKHLNMGIELLKSLPDTPTRTQNELALHIALGASLMALRGNASSEAERAYLKARELCERMGHAPELFPVLFGLWRYCVTRPKLQTAAELADDLLSLADNAKDPAQAVIAHYAVGFSRYQSGDFIDARQHQEAGIAQYAPQQRRISVFRIAQDPGVGCRSYSGLSLWHLGLPDQALTRTQEGLALALELKHPLSVAFARCWLALLCQFRRDTGAVQAHAEAALALATEQEFALWAAMATIFRGWALAMRDKREEGALELAKGIAAWQATGAGTALAYYCTMQAEVFDLLGRGTEALQRLEEAQAEVERTGERWWEAEIYRVRGVLLLRHSMASQSEAESWICRALEVARRQKAKSLELRAATSLARLWRDLGKPDKGRHLLAPINGWFAEGFDTVDLTESRALLDDLTCKVP
jgi:predicted ATPase